MDFNIAIVHQYFAEIHKLLNLFLKIDFSLICYGAINEITISQENNVWFQKFMHKVTAI